MKNEREVMKKRLKVLAHKYIKAKREADKYDKAYTALANKVYNTKGLPYTP